MDLPTLPQRDSKIWAILAGAGSFLLVVMTLIDNPADYGISLMAFKWAKLFVAAITIVGAKFGWSWAKLDPKV